MYAERRPNFPLAYNATGAITLFDATNLFYQHPIIMAIALGVVVLIQLFGLFFVARGEEVGTAVAGLRAAIVMHAITMCSFWPFVIYIALVPTDTSINILLFSAIPTLVQFLFGCYNAAYTDILRLGPSGDRDTHPVIAVCIVASKLLPFALLAIISTCSAAYYVAQEPGEREAYQSTIIAMVTILLIFIFVYGLSYSRNIAFQAVNGWKYVMDTFFSGEEIEKSASDFVNVLEDSKLYANDQVKIASECASHTIKTTAGNVIPR